MSVLPEALPTVENYEFGALIAPARAVGGDFYNILPIGRSRLAVVIGDVTDKGVPAAIFMAQTHALLQAEAGHGRSPRDTLLRVNKQLLRMNARGMFVTVLYGMLDIRTGEFCYARAGHELPLLCRGRGVVVAAWSRSAAGDPVPSRARPANAVALSRHHLVALHRWRYGYDWTGWGYVWLAKVAANATGCDPSRAPRAAARRYSEPCRFTRARQPSSMTSPWWLSSACRADQRGSSPR